MTDHYITDARGVRIAGVYSTRDRARADLAHVTEGVRSGRVTKHCDGVRVTIELPLEVRSSSDSSWQAA